MKKYKEYMDNVRASDTLHQRLVGLEASEKRPIPWKRYGALAAALVLVVGLGAWGLGKAGGWGALKVNFDPLADHTSIPKIADESIPDIALVGPDDVTEPGEKTIGGYEVISGSGENAIAAYYVLPYIEYGDVNGTVVCLDWDIPAGATRRELTGDEIVALMGGKDAVNTHLDWGEFNLFGWAAWYEDGSFWGAYINGQKIPGDLPPYASYPCPNDRFEFAVTAGMLPPTCVVYPASVTQEIRGLEISADGHDSADASTRRVSFMKDDYGYRFDLTSTDTSLAEKMVSRLVCRIADQGLDWSVVPGVKVSDFEPNYDPAYEDGVPDYVSGCPYCADGTPHTHPYDPSEYDTTAAYTCAECGVTIPAGDKHYHTQDGTYTCPNCGETVLDDAAHRHEDGYICSGYPTPDGDICGLPLAPSTHTCEVCGETLPEGMEHSHSDDHHDDHHSDHH